MCIDFIDRNRAGRRRAGGRCAAGWILVIDTGLRLSRVDYLSPAHCVRAVV